MFLAFRAAGAKDWRSHLAIALDHSGSQHRLQFHHIFPKALLRGGYRPARGRRHRQSGFHRRQTNRAISDKAPAAYLLPLVAQHGETPFAAQCIPVEKELASGSLQSVLARAPQTHRGGTECSPQPRELLEKNNSGRHTLNKKFITSPSLTT